jgi:hypothetical protein
MPTIVSPSNTTVAIDMATFNATVYKAVADHMALDINAYPGGSSAYMEELARLRKEFYNRPR